MLFKEKNFTTDPSGYSFLLIPRGAHYCIDDSDDSGTHFNLLFIVTTDYGCENIESVSMGGYSVDATINIELANYIGNVNNIRRRMMETRTPNGDIPTLWVSGGAAAGGKIGVTAYVTSNVGGSFIIGRELNLGVGLPAGPPPANGAGGASNTWILYDFYN